MNSCLLKKNITEDSFREYIERIVNIFKLSNKESSIIFDLKIEDYRCIMKLTVIKQNGEREEFTDNVVECNQKFYQNFLDVLVSNFLGSIKVVTKDIVPFRDNSLVTFRLITENNDLFSINGLSIEHAKYLMDLDKIEEDKYLSYSDNKGIGSIWMFTFMIIILIVVFILVVLLLG